MTLQQEIELAEFFELSNQQDYYCSTQYPNPPYPCPLNFDTVCAKYQPQCVRPPCPLFEAEYSSDCLACNDPTVVSYRYGPCEPGYENEEFYLENEELTYENEDFVGAEYNQEIHVCNMDTLVKVLCDQSYIPVCGYFDNCESGACRKTFYNSCEACYYGGADYYTDEECPSE